MDLTREAIDRLTELGETKILTIRGKEYSSKHIELVEEPVPNTIQFSCLDSVIGYINSSIDSLIAERLFLNVIAPDTVVLLSYIEMSTMQRAIWCGARLMAHQFAFGNSMGQEEFTIALQTQFVQTLERDQLLKIVGSITADEITVSDDDGVTQRITLRSGVTLKDRIELPSPIVLTPYRTFREVDQVDSPFILRARKSSAGTQLSLHEADGGAWKLEAVARVAQYLGAKITKPIPILA